MKHTAALRPVASAGEPAQDDPWRDLAGMADLAFETDEDGRLTRVAPDPALGWPAAALRSRPGRELLAAGYLGENPFQPTRPIRGRPVWLRRADGSTGCFAVSAAPAGSGARGLAVALPPEAVPVADTALHRARVIDDILARIRQEVLAPRMMRVVLQALAEALAAEGAAVIDGAVVLHQIGAGAGGAFDTALAMVEHGGEAEPACATAPDGRPVLVCPCQTRFGEAAGLALWRPPAAASWTESDRLLAGSAAGIVRLVLDHQAIQREMARQARTDPLTGLLNRRGFMEELPRHIERLEREQLFGTLILADLDGLRAVNDQHGHAAGDQALLRAAKVLRAALRPTDLVARLGGDDFALWMNGADHLTAAERADYLRREMPRQLADAIGAAAPAVSISIGIAMRAFGTDSEPEAVIRRAEFAMREVKRESRGHWRVAHEGAA